MAKAFESSLYIVSTWHLLLSAEIQYWENTTRLVTVERPQSCRLYSFALAFDVSSYPPKLSSIYKPLHPWIRVLCSIYLEAWQWNSIQAFWARSNKFFKICSPLTEFFSTYTSTSTSTSTFTSASSSPPRRCSLLLPRAGHLQRMCSNFSVPISQNGLMRPVRSILFKWYLRLQWPTK